MKIYTSIILDSLGRMLIVTCICTICMLILILGIDQLVIMPENIPWVLIAKYLSYELVHITCWVIPIAVYIATTTWAVYAVEEQFIYRLFHAGWNKTKIYLIQSILIIPIIITSILMNIYYLPIARVAQKQLLKDAYNQDAKLYIEQDRFHQLKLGDEHWIIYSQKKDGQNEIYAFNKQQQDTHVIFSQNIDTDTENRQIVLENGIRTSISPTQKFPIILLKYKRYGLGLPVIDMINSNEKANYSVMIWHIKDMDHRLEAYNRIGRIMMTILLSFTPLILIRTNTTRQKLKIISQALFLYILYWIIFISCRWILMLDNYQHLALIMLPHVLFGIQLIAIYKVIKHDNIFKTH